LTDKYEILPNSLPSYRYYFTNNTDKIGLLSKFCNMFFYKRFTLTMDPLNSFRQNSSLKSGGARPPRSKYVTYGSKTNQGYLEREFLEKEFLDIPGLTPKILCG